MKYISIFFTILLIWIALIIIAVVRTNEQSYALFFTTIVCTVILFLIGFAKK